MVGEPRSHAPTLEKLEHTTTYYNFITLKRLETMLYNMSFAQTTGISKHGGADFYDQPAWVVPSFRAAEFQLRHIFWAGFGTGFGTGLGVGLEINHWFWKNFFPYFHISTTGFFNFFQRLEIGHGWGDFTLRRYELPTTISRVANDEIPGLPNTQPILTTSDNI